MTIKISLFTREYYDEVVALWKQCEGIGLSGADSPENLQGYLERFRGLSFVALHEGRVVGAVLGGHDGRRGYIYHLAVAPDCRRKGVARKLVDDCLAALAAVRIQKCHAFVYAKNTGGLAFWQAIGWIPRSDIGVVSRDIEAEIKGDSRWWEKATLLKNLVYEPPIEAADLDCGHVFQYSDFVQLTELDVVHVDSTFLDCTFKQCDFYWTLFNNVLCVNSTFENCAFSGVSFAHCRFVDCSFDGCVFTKDNLGGDCDYRGTKWYGCSQSNCTGLDGAWG